MKYGMVSDMAHNEGEFHILGVLEGAAPDPTSGQLESATVLLDDAAGETYTLRVESQAYHDIPDSSGVEGDPEPVFLYPGHIDSEVLQTILEIPKPLLSKYVVKQDVASDEPEA